MDEFRYLPPEQAFLDPDRADAETPEKAQAVVVPFALEASVSYGTGTAQDPEAILAASHQLELFDDELWCQACDDYGIATIPSLALRGNIHDCLMDLSQVIELIRSAGKFPLTLGGEHALTPGAVKPFAKHYDDLVVLQIDAHADLRDGYLGETYSHASAMRRVLDLPNVSLVSVGIRALCQEEAEFYEANRNRISMHMAHSQRTWKLDEIIAPLKNKPVYITFDVDGLDAAVMPATGTPVPGGLSFLDAMAIVRKAATVADRIVGADVVELAPIPGLHGADFTAAAIAYKIMNYALCGTSPRR